MEPCRLWSIECTNTALKTLRKTCPTDGYELRRLHYDIAGTAYRPAIAALTSLVPTTQILFGSDNPFIPLAETAEGMVKLGFSAVDLQRIGRENALALLPQLKSH